MRRATLFGACSVLLLGFAGGCGTMRTTNTQRTATEQMLISDAIDRAVQSVHFAALEGKSVYFDDRHLYDVVDSGYLISSLRQHLLASGATLKEQRESADFVVEARAGAVGTDNHDLLFGMPATNLPQVALLPAMPPAIPEIPIAKRRVQRGVAKIAVFAYRRESGESVWQSGIVANESKANDIWILGAGPFKRGTIYSETSFAGAKVERQPPSTQQPATRKVVKVSDEAMFETPPLSAPNRKEALAQQAPSKENLHRDQAVRPVAAYEALTLPLLPKANSSGLSGQ